MQLDGYIRVSRVRGREGDSFISPDLQREQIQSWAKLRGVEVVTWHTDLDQSGAKSDRPGLTEALRRAQAGESGGIVVAKLDRFARSLMAALDAIRKLDEAGAQFVSVAEGIDPTTPAGKMMQRLMLVLAEFELDRMRETWNAAQERAVARGVHIASRTPTGYIRNGDGRLSPHPDYAPAIAKAFRMRAAGESWRTLCRYLDEQGVVGPYGAANWRTRALHHLIANRVYLGEARSGRHVNPDAHEPLIDRPTWEAAQAARGASSPRSQDPALLAGILRCAGCRHLMKPDSQKLRSGERVRLYRCRGEHASGTCGERAAVLGRVVEPYVERVFLNAVGDLIAEGNPASEQIEQARTAVEEAERELGAYRDDQRIADVLGVDRYVEGLRVRADATDDAHRALGELQARFGVGGLTETASLVESWPELSVADKQRLLLATLDCVFVRAVGRGQVPIERRTLALLRGEAPDDLPRRGRRVGLRPFVWPERPDQLGAAAA
jgi:DNA invertase Pin-like site-specific DNA recombinase